MLVFFSADRSTSITTHHAQAHPCNNTSTTGNRTRLDHAEWIGPKGLKSSLQLVQQIAVILPFTRFVSLTTPNSSPSLSKLDAVFPGPDVSADVSVRDQHSRLHNLTTCHFSVHWHIGLHRDRGILYQTDSYPKKPVPSSFLYFPSLSFPLPARRPGRVFFCNCTKAATLSFAIDDGGYE